MLADADGQIRRADRPPECCKPSSVRADALVSDSLVYRYAHKRAASDGLLGREGTFSMCTFWLVEALARAGEISDARLIFEKMLTYANPLGLFSEEIAPSGEALGNFPQAFSHLALISAAYNLGSLPRPGRAALRAVERASDVPDG